MSRQEDGAGTVPATSLTAGMNPRGCGHGRCGGRCGRPVARWVCRLPAAQIRRLRRLARHAAVFAECVFGRLVAGEDHDHHAAVRVAPLGRVIALRGTEFAEADHGQPRRIHASLREQMHDARGARRGQLPVRRERGRADRAVVGVAFDAHRVRILGERRGQASSAGNAPRRTASRRRSRTGCRCGFRLRARVDGGAPRSCRRPPAAASAFSISSATRAQLPAAR